MKRVFGVVLLSLASAIGVSAPIADLQLKSATPWTPAAISSLGYETTPTFTPDGSLMVYLAADAAFRTYQLAASRCVRGRWSPPERLGFGMPLPIFDADPGFTVDGQRLFFISTRKGSNADDFDIWSISRDEKGGWGQPDRLPAPVNSPSSELLPRMDGTGTLYFGSNRAGGYGQGDIYAARQKEDGGWTVENVGPPVSTSAFEYEAEISRDGKTMVVVADRGDRSHLYLYKKVDGRWIERGRIPARRDEFQVGPLLSPKADRLIFAERSGKRSGEMFLMDLVPEPDRTWPPSCPPKAAWFPTRKKVSEAGKAVRVTRGESPMLRSR